jgi:L-alanine-DL-glutamate epimerase-like enolase superfamily enzyme
MANNAGIKIRSSSMRRRDFLKMLGVTAVATTGIPGIIDPFNFAKAAITPGEKGIYITDMYIGQLTGCGGVIVRLDTNKGISGYGECRENDSYVVTDLSHLKPTIIGMNPTQIDRVFNAMNNAILAYYDPHSAYYMNLIPPRSGAMCGIEVACWDIIGKVYNVPIWKLIGPKLRDRVRLCCDTDEKTAAALPQYVQSRLDMGFTWFKADMYLTSLCSFNTDYTSQSESGYPYTCYTIKDSGLQKFADYAAQYRSLIGNDYPLSSDHYQGWASKINLDVPSAVKLANLMSESSYQGMNGGWMEDIIQWWYPDQFAQVTAGTDMPILTGEDIYGLSELQPWIDAKALDFIHPDQATFGGIYETRRAALYAHSKGIFTALHCAGGPFSFAANLHIAAGIPDFLALEYHHVDNSCNSWFDSVVDGFVRPFIQSDGHSYLPNGPGLGITPNATASSHGLSWTRVT